MDVVAILNWLIIWPLKFRELKRVNTLIVVLTGKVKLRFMPRSV